MLRKDPKYRASFLSITAKGLLMVIALLALVTQSLAQESPAQTENQPGKGPDLSSIKWQKGPAKADINNLAGINVPEGYVYADAKDTKTLMEVMGNPVTGKEAGLLAPNSMDWFVVFEFSDIGYVKDDEKTQLDSNAILDSIKEGNDQANEERIPPQWARNTVRFAAGIGLASPGVPMFFEGDESMAQNNFKWGVPSTWDIGWDWESLGKNWDWNNITFTEDQQRLYRRLFDMPAQERQNDTGYKNLSVADRQVFNDLAALAPEEREKAMLDIARRQTFIFYKDAIALRESSPAFEADAQVTRVYTHNDNSVMAFTRKYGNDEFLVIGSLNHNNLQGYQMPLPPGQWKEVLNSDAAKYGGSNFGNFGATINGGSSQVNIPAGGYVILKKV